MSHHSHSKDHNHHHGHDHHAHDEHSHEGHHHGGFGHHHVHAPDSFGAVFAIGIALNSAYVIAETIWGVWAHSLSLLADAGHNLSDILGLAAAWFAQILAKRAPSGRFTYGLKRATILTALGNAVILLLVTGGIVWEAILHLITTDTVHGPTVSLVAFIGIIVNGLTAWLFVKGSKHDLNMRGAFLHMASDAVMALSVVIAGFAISWTGFNIIDPIVSLIVSFAIIWATWSLLTQSLNLALDGVPASINTEEVANALKELPEIADLHHLHIWPMSTTETALTVHIVPETIVPEPSAHQLIKQTRQIINQANELLRKRFAIQHPTFQIEDRTPHCLNENCEPLNETHHSHSH
ncbi:cation diffusion facilitator family transporter [Aristophania vespae]|uniref:cation diffusion facilitator family transporter n=1 Tax=Aristophania vespae TaxID=2697033 RepID=UPI002351847A|nr:cation diffusion facilitator family transporter [Aristophania vespae]UMM64444.1 Cadmium, cobalt and zinc/H(+)-K(+) antiporter [Aristophania vespae]